MTLLLPADAVNTEDYRRRVAALDREENGDLVRIGERLRLIMQNSRLRLVQMAGPEATFTWRARLQPRTG